MASQLHHELREVMRESLRRAATAESSVGSGLSICFDESDPDRMCAPDAFLRLGVPQGWITTWKTWEQGAPELCIEILSPSEPVEKAELERSLVCFRIMGVREVIAFDTSAPVGGRLRAWDLASGELVPRTIENERTPCRTLDLWFVIAPCAHPVLDHALRLAQTASGDGLVPTPVEAIRAES